MMQLEERLKRLEHRTTRLDELTALLKDVKEPKKSFILSMLEDFVWLEAEINLLRIYPRYIVDPRNPKNQKTLEVHKMLKDYQAQKNDIATKILRTLDIDNVSEDSALAKALAAFNDD